MPVSGSRSTRACKPDVSQLQNRIETVALVRGVGGSWLQSLASLRIEANLTNPHMDNSAVMELVTEVAYLFSLNAVLRINIHPFMPKRLAHNLFTCVTKPSLQETRVDTLKHPC